ncbi:unnamed protein product [Parnassius apollo]|uniref:(apollo) hypothetical protein n=1 Tax=Parnassius apollo TaxID=110799 RepID=A0A8S3Y0B6_PARAO|nr:unnamed protein product [Parnassius apollo]
MTPKKVESKCLLNKRKDKNEPGRFLGEGVSFRAKLIGVLEVPEARGDRMCQEALADLKMAIRAAGEHKQRIQVHVAIDGLRLRDDKTGDSLYHHPVHKISFIAQDMTDSRAFGYIFGSPDTGHRFFGIKTDKAASQVVIAMRDLFQVVFELKKKEVEMAKQQLEGKSVTNSLVRHNSTVTETKPKSLSSVGETSAVTAKGSESGAGGGVAELVDLEQELCSLRRGLTQVEGLTPSTDPFGDSFLAPSPKGLIPPPPGATSRGRSTPARTTFSPNKPSTLSFDLSAVAGDFEPKPASLPLVENVPDPPELKNPPKKVLKDLVPTTHTLLSDIVPVTTEPNSDGYGPTTTMTSLTRQSGGSVAVAKPSQPPMYTGGFFTSDPFAETDPFDNTDPFSDTFKEDPFTGMSEFPKPGLLRMDDTKSKLSKDVTLDKPEIGLDSGKNVFNGPLQVTLPPEPAPKSPRMQRQMTDTSTIRQRPQPSSKLNAEKISPPPLPPKKFGEIYLSRPSSRLTHDLEHESEETSESGPPLPRPARKREPLAERSMKPRRASGASGASSSGDEYLTPAPPPLPAARRFDITLSQLLTCTMEELAARYRTLHTCTATSRSASCSPAPWTNWPPGTTRSTHALRHHSQPAAHLHHGRNGRQVPHAPHMHCDITLSQLLTCAMDALAARYHTLHSCTATSRSASCSPAPWTNWPPGTARSTHALRHHAQPAAHLHHGRAGRQVPHAPHMYFDITLSQLLTCTMDELAARYRTLHTCTATSRSASCSPAPWTSWPPGTARSTHALRHHAQPAAHLHHGRASRQVPHAPHMHCYITLSQLLTCTMDELAARYRTLHTCTATSRSASCSPAPWTSWPPGTARSTHALRHHAQPAAHLHHGRASRQVPHAPHMHCYITLSQLLTCTMDELAARYRTLYTCTATSRSASCSPAPWTGWPPGTARSTHALRHHAQPAAHLHHGPAGRQVPHAPHMHCDVTLIQLLTCTMDELAARHRTLHTCTAISRSASCSPAPWTSWPPGTARSTHALRHHAQPAAHLHHGRASRQVPHAPHMHCDITLSPLLTCTMNELAARYRTLHRCTATYCSASCSSAPWTSWPPGTVRSTHALRHHAQPAAHLRHGRVGRQVPHAPHMHCDITLSQLLTCTMDELAARYRTLHTCTATSRSASCSPAPWTSWPPGTARSTHALRHHAQPAAHLHHGPAGRQVPHAPHMHCDVTLIQLLTCTMDELAARHRTLHTCTAISRSASCSPAPWTSWPPGTARSTHALRHHAQPAAHLHHGRVGRQVPHAPHMHCDITLSQLLTCTMDELAARYRTLHTCIATSLSSSCSPAPWTS